MVRIDAEADADRLETACADGGLATGHACRSVVENHDGDVGVLPDGVEDARHAGMGERRIADDGDGRMDARVRGALRHRDGGAHVDAGRNRLEGRQRAEGVAADVAENARVFELGDGFLQRVVGADVGAAVAEARRTHLHKIRNRRRFRDFQIKRLRDEIRVEFACARQMAGKAAHDARVFQRAAELRFDEGGALFHDHDLVAFI